jgi:molybdopterin-guanine dinucleotide biosynthesis protein A
MRGALILTGGRSRRFGRNKALVKLGGKPLLLHVVDAAMDVADEIVVAIGREHQVDSYTGLVPESVRVLRDAMQEKSPLVGIITGFEVMKSEYSLVLSNDTPFAKQRVLEYLFKRAAGSDAAIPRWMSGGLEPLQSVYRVRSALPAAKVALSERGFRNVDMIKRLRRVTYIPVSVLKRLDSDLITFFNVNTRSDLRRANRIYSPDTQKL